MSDYILNLTNVGVLYKSKEMNVDALDSINLNIKKHEFVCVLGPSGCGKSTLLNVIAGYLKPTTGTAKIKDDLITKPDKNRGVVFQSPTLYPWLNVTQNIEFGLNMLGVSNEEKTKISNHLLKEVGLEDFANSYSFDLSGGMRQRVSLARVLANDPEIILMDEPFGALDALTRLKMQSLVRNLWQKNKSTVFMITHDIDEALTLGTRIVVMSPGPGKIEEDIEVGYTYEALKDPKGRVKVDMEYLKIKEHLLDLIE